MKLKQYFSSFNTLFFLFPRDDIWTSGDQERDVFPITRYRVFSSAWLFCKCCLLVLFSALLHKILVENPSVRITIPDIKKDRWYNKLLKKGKHPSNKVFLFCEIRNLTRMQAFWNNHCEGERKLSRETRDWLSVEDPAEDSNHECIVASFSV